MLGFRDRQGPSEILALSRLTPISLIAGRWTLTRKEGELIKEARREIGKDIQNKWKLMQIMAMKEETMAMKKEMRKIMTCLRSTMASDISSLI